MNENGRETSKKTLCPPVPAQKELTNQYLLSDEVVLITLLEFIVLYSGICGQPRHRVVGENRCNRKINITSYFFLSLGMKSKHS